MSQNSSPRPFSKYDNETLLKVHANLERGVKKAVDTIADRKPGDGYAVNSYHMSLGLLADVEDELFERGVDPHDR